MKTKALSLFLILKIFAISLYAQELPKYYSIDFLQSYQNHSIKNKDLLDSLFNMLKTGHNALGYDKGRKMLFGRLHLKTLQDGTYAVNDVYCERDFTDHDLGQNSIGPDMLPRSGNIINTEHTWPQSKFSNRFTKDFQKSDLHHLFPTDSEMNSKRGSYRFGNVTQDKERLKCPQNRLGKQAEGGDLVFEVPDNQKGNTARAIFYFATRYQMKLNKTEETTLREWHAQDPVDVAEFERNNGIEKLQGNRNPYIDFPELLNDIDSFNYNY